MSATVVLVALTSKKSFKFRLPNSDRKNVRPNWRPMDTANGPQPILYANRSPKVLTFPELWLDNTATNESLTPMLEDLESHCDEDDHIGMPPPLLAVWGDRKFRCVIQNLDYETTFYSSKGEPLRAKVMLELLEIQEGAEATSVNVI